ncbi:hypothetical protein M8J76_011117, partial [Diaphorina citri]
GSELHHGRGFARPSTPPPSLLEKAQPIIAAALPDGWREWRVIPEPPPDTPPGPCGNGTEVPSPDGGCCEDTSPRVQGSVRKEVQDHQERSLELALHSGAGVKSWQRRKSQGPLR